METVPDQGSDRPPPGSRHAELAPLVGTGQGAGRAVQGVVGTVLEMRGTASPARGRSSRRTPSAIFGTIDLDLRQARLSDPETVIEVYNLLGTVTVIVPDGVEVVVRGGGLFASQKIQSPERAPVGDGRA